MKKTLISATFPMLFFSTWAHAQSSVTLYGVIDEGFDYISNVNGKGFYGLVNGEAVGSRWGIRGTEDLGGGLSAIFRLESGFNTNTGKMGQGGLEFGRQAYVGLASKQYGTATLGRQPNSAVDMWSAGMILLFFLTGKFPLFQANDDVEALLEIACIIGRRRMEKAATLHGERLSEAHAVRCRILIRPYSPDVHHEYSIDYSRRETLVRIRRDAESEAAGADKG